VDADGWGDDAPPVSRSKLESVPSAYTPTKVDIKALRAQPSGSSSYDRPEPVKGAYQPIGKVDIAEIRRKAGEHKEDRPEPVKGAYQPIGKVDIAAIRAQAKPSQEEREETPPPKPVSERTAAFSQAERITALPKPKPAKKFGGAPSLGTKPLTPGFTPPSVASVAGASVDYASQGGKTPAQLWAEKKARERGYSGASETPPPAFQSASHTGRSQTSNDGGASNPLNPIRPVEVLVT
jgi:drebrin-like protein